MRNNLKYLITLLIIATFSYVLYVIPIKLGLDLQGGTHLVLEVQENDKVIVNEETVSGVLQVIQNRIDGLGVTEPIIRRKGKRQIIVELAGVKNPERAIDIIGQTALLEFRQAEWAPSNIGNLSEEKQNFLIGETGVLSEYNEYDKLGKLQSTRPIILKENIITGKHLKLANAMSDNYGNPYVSIEFDKNGGKLLKELTQLSIGKPIAIILDNVIISAPNVSETIPNGKAMINGSFTVNEIRDLVIKLKAGSLPAPVKILSNKIVGPTLGLKSIEKSKLAFIIGFSGICLFMILFYKLPGFVSCLSLISYVIILFGSLKLLNATLTLPGIAGIILTMGMAVDANIIIFERIKEEKENNNDITSIIKYGFHRASRTILDANITTLVAALVLFWIGTGPIRGFAVTLSLGILVSMFSSLIFTKQLLELIPKLTNTNKSLILKGIK